MHILARLAPAGHRHQKVRQRHLPDLLAVGAADANALAPVAGRDQLNVAPGAVGLGGGLGLYCYICPLDRV
jgi:hypothetical protein